MKTEKQKDIEEYYKSKLNKAINLQIALILLMFFMMVISGLMKSGAFLQKYAERGAIASIIIFLWGIA